VWMVEGKHHLAKILAKVLSVTRLGKFIKKTSTNENQCFHVGFSGCLL
jgi:hypothetical protein